MSKIVFVLHRKQGTSREECLAERGSRRPAGIVGRIPSSKRWVRNDVVGEPGGSVCDGIGEMWFEGDSAVEATLVVEMGAAVEDAKGFLGMDRTGLVIVRGVDALA